MGSAAVEAAKASISDVIIIGAGLAGSCAANVLAKAGYDVSIVDTQAISQPEFRAEKLPVSLMQQIERLGLGDVTRSVTTTIKDIRTYRFGQLFAQENYCEYTFAYSTLVNAIRAAMPARVTPFICRVDSIETSGDHQMVRLNDGRTLQARLIIIATGLGDAVRRKAGILRKDRSKAHSLSLGFNLEQPASAFPFQSLNYFAHQRADRVAYLSLFQIDNLMRGNLFVYHDAKDPWTKQFRAAPQAHLQAMMPEIARICGGFQINGHVEVRQIDLTRSEDFRRDGVVLLGDAFCSTCPVPGVGVQRVLTDVEQLCTVHLPRWMASPGMGLAKISQFYDDPIKIATDSSAMHHSEYARAMVMEDGLIWAARRWRNNGARRAMLMHAKAMRRLKALGLPVLRPTHQPTRDVMGA